jgi:hypothetical protein
VPAEWTCARCRGFNREDDDVDRNQQWDFDEDEKGQQEDRVFSGFADEDEYDEDDEQEDEQVEQYHENGNEFDEHTKAMAGEVITVARTGDWHGAT